ncbi:GNAT family N-acetyltransferase [Chitinophaga japonensis]|uniref:Acetyltransferase (GNAT) family protein n=1 Tax=Chitinophaga japonensis TaxID=104662 RepID=A0A562T4U4_CHIJA|nr:GNAT family N-acetyltransferase [Chitinophaga japonensis]TWI88264.1 acetyltransferase (GNAT) family protein [Chitinophaga japonensis]
MGIVPSLDVLRNATPAQLEQAAAYNHRELFCLEATARGGEVCTNAGLTWTYAGPDHAGMVAFPALPDERAGLLLDEMMAWYRAHPPRGAGCWSLYPPLPADIGVRLLARGFQPGWWPCWMALDLANIRHHPNPPGLQVLADNSLSTLPVQDLPYGGDEGAVSPAFIAAHPERVQRFIAVLDGNIVGHSCVLFSTGPYGAAGIYNVGVVPAMRRRGIGKAVVLAACRYAQELGYHYAVLNATGRRMYQQVGFQWISDGRTWWLQTSRFITHPPTPDQVALAEAVGRGDLPALEGPGSLFNSNDLNRPITNGMTLVELAVHCRQPAAAQWLMDHGAACTPLAAWDLGWKDRAAALLAADPAAVNHLYGHLQNTLLHIAAERNDVALAQLALAARPNLQLKDKVYNGTPLDWALHFQRAAITRLIQAQMDAS